MEVYAVCANFTDGCTYGFSEVQHVFADRDIAEYIVDAANEKAGTGMGVTTYLVDVFTVSDKTSMKQADKIVQALIKEYNS